MAKKTPTSAPATRRSNVRSISDPRPAQNPVASSTSAPVSSEPTSTPATPSQTAEGQTTMATITFKKNRTNKGGNTLYSAEGYIANVRFPKSLFAEGVTPPDSVDITFADGVLAAPGSAKVGGGRSASPEAIAKAQEKLQKSKDRLAKAQARIAKQEASAAKLLAKAGITPEAPAETAQPVE